MGLDDKDDLAILAPGATELLSPARDLSCGVAAIDCGADAVYVGAPRFGAREAAGNSLEEIAALARHAHRYRARVYVALNTLLTDQELPAAAALARELGEAGADALIIQDPGLLLAELPPLPLIASTQMDNSTPERVAFLERAGFSRAILARELSLAQVREVRRAAPGIELEAFVHGALCVSRSGRCFLSLALGGPSGERSANRGRCAQPCRRWYRAFDEEGAPAAEGHLLSLRDLALHRRLGDLLDAGVTSFKIEGRLKDAAYVANITAFYRARLDEELAARGLARSSSGESRPGFDPDPAKTFNRGYTEYFLDGKAPPGGVATFSTPKMVGEEVGRVAEGKGGEVLLEREAPLAPGDGVAWFDDQGVLTGTVVNAVRGRALVPDRASGLTPGRVLYRNRDQAFLSALAAARPRRSIPVRLTLRLTDPARGLESGLTLAVEDSDGVAASALLPGPLPPAAKPGPAREALARSLAKTGDTCFSCREVVLDLPVIPFLPVSSANALRREALAALEEVREATRPRPHRGPLPRGEEPFPHPEGDFALNVLNRAASAFYHRHGVEPGEPAAETGVPLDGRRVMTCRTCLRRELGRCPGRERAGKAGAAPWTLQDDTGRLLTLRFDCATCGMEVYLGTPRPR